MAENEISEGVKTGSQSFGSLKAYWENMSSQRMEADCIVPSRSKSSEPIIVPLLKSDSPKLKTVSIKIRII